MTTLSKEDVVLMATDSGGELIRGSHPGMIGFWPTALNRFVTLARADLVAENESLKADLSKYRATRQYKEARKAEVAVLREQLTEAMAENERLNGHIKTVENLRAISVDAANKAWIEIDGLRTALAAAEAQIKELTGK